MAKPIAEDIQPQASDWVLFALIVAIGGSSFAMIRGAVETIPPIVVTVGRLWVGALFLLIVMVQAGRRLPPVLKIGGGGISAEWRSIIAISIVGYVIPFMIFPWAQQYIESGLAGIYMAFMPIWTVFLAYIFAGESLSWRKIIGLILGVAGVVLLIGPDVIADAATTNITAQIMLLIATFGYAAAAVITRKAPPMRPRAFAAGTLLTAALLSTPALLFIELNAEEWSLAGIINVIGLGLGPTGLAGVLLIVLIQRVGAGFMAFANYVTPFWAVAMGALLFNERLDPSAFIALVIILIGVAISQRRGRVPVSTEVRSTEIRPR